MFQWCAVLHGKCSSERGSLSVPHGWTDGASMRTASSRSSDLLHDSTAMPHPSLPTDLLHATFLLRHSALTSCPGLFTMLPLESMFSLQSEEKYVTRCLMYN